jgi:hypothetical protein
MTDKTPNTPNDDTSEVSRFVAKDLQKEIDWLKSLPRKPIFLEEARNKRLNYEKLKEVASETREFLEKYEREKYDEFSASEKQTFNLLEGISNELRDISKQISKDLGVTNELRDIRKQISKELGVTNELRGIRKQIGKELGVTIDKLRTLHTDVIKSQRELLRSNVAITNQLELQNERIERILEQTRQFEVRVNDGVKRITSSILYAAAAIIAVIVVF